MKSPGGMIILMVFAACTTDFESADRDDGEEDVGPEADDDSVQTDLEDPDAADPGTDDGTPEVPDADSADAPDLDDVTDGEEVEPTCTEPSDCDDGDVCNGEETCNMDLDACEEGTPPGDGFLCRSDPRSICLDGSCSESTCGDGFVDTGSGESCEPPDTGACDSECHLQCTSDSDCPDDANPCNGEEYCNTTANVCERRNPLDDGDVCGSSPRRICLSGLCQQSICGDGFTDPVPGEECDDGNGTQGDGCDNDCTYSCHDDGECDDGHVCTDDVCNNASHVCEFPTHSGGTLCRAAAGDCDVAETCDGTNVDCPANAFQPSSHLCRGLAGDCDTEEYCTGSSATCPADAFRSSSTVCRTSAGLCDVQETCPGTSAACPADTLRPSSYECRSRTGDCDVRETCTGTSADCPGDAVAPSGTLCRGMAGDCDIAENCDGSSKDCPTDIFRSSLLICRSAAHYCDAPEFCPGDGPSCPADAAYPYLHGVLSVSASMSNHTCALLENGSVRCWGANTYGQCGQLASGTDHRTPVEVTNLSSGVAKLSSGGNFNCVIRSSGTVQCWGQNNFGQLGNGSTMNTHVPQTVSLPEAAVDVSAGYYHACAVLSGGGVRCWGYNNAGQLGDGSNVNSSVPVTVRDDTTPSYPPLDEIVAVACGSNFSCSLKQGTGEAWCWGGNANGQLGDGTTSSHFRASPVRYSAGGTVVRGFVKITAGNNHACGVKDNTVCWGRGDYGQLGNNSTSDSLVPTQVLQSGPADFPAASYIDAGYAHTCAVQAAGGWCWGRDEEGQLGDGTVNPNRPLAAMVSGLTSTTDMISGGGSHSCAVHGTGDIAKCWGLNLDGQLGNGTTTLSAVPVEVLCE